MLGNMERAVEAGDVTQTEYDRVDCEYRALLAPYAERGARKDDRLHLVYVGADGDVMLDEHLGEVWARAVRASFTGEESEMQEKLGELAWGDLGGRGDCCVKLSEVRLSACCGFRVSPLVADKLQNV